MQEGAAQISLRLDSNNGVIAGQISDGDREVAFAGWLELVAALEAARKRQVPEEEKAE